MQGVNHKRIGAGTALVAGHAAGLPIVFIAGTAAIAYVISPLPDIDQKIGFIKHRTITHWAATCLAFAGLCFLLTYWYIAPNLAPLPFIGAWMASSLAQMIGIGVAIGCLAHIIADSMTIKGIPFFGPFYRRPVHLLPRFLWVRVGNRDEESTSENVAMLVLLSMGVLYFALAFNLL